jgi:predicted membrane-bound mannosyltransferase
MSKKGKKTRPVKPPVKTAARPAPAATVEAVDQKPDVPTGPPLPSFEWPDFNDRLWFRCAAFITVLGAFLRFVVIELRPVHHDEGVNGFFLANLIRDGLYKYDPANYHGPIIYYIALPLVEMFGYKTWAIRVVPAVFGTLIVVLALYLKRYIGNVGSLIAAFFLAISAGMLFISRYFIHEIIFVFLSLAIVVAVLRYLERRPVGRVAVGWMVFILLVCFIQPVLMVSKYLGGESTTLVWALSLGLFAVEAVLVYYITQWLTSWDQGRPIYLMLASASVSLLFATKETAFITIGTMAIALICVWLWKNIKPAKKLNQDWFRIVIGAHIVLAGLAIYFRSSLSDAWEWTHEWYLSGRFQPPDYLIFGAIVFVIAATIVAWIFFLADLRKTNETDLADALHLSVKNFREALGDRTNAIVTAAACVTIFAYLFILFFSSFFTYKEGVLKAFEAYNIWSGTGTKEHAQNGYFAYLKWGGKVESPLLILSFLGAFIAMLKTKHRFAMFTSLWAIGLFAAYTIIPYKTPWLALSYLLPMCIIAGYGLSELYASKDIKLKTLAAALAVVGSFVLAYQSYQHNFINYDDDKMPYVYAHTRRGFLGLMEKIDHYAEKSGKGPDCTIEIVSPDYWPMTWYTMKYNHANYQGHLVDVTTSEFIVAKKRDQDAEVIKKYSEHYKYVGMYPLRPGVDLNLLVRRDLADPDTQELSVIPSVPMTP